MENITKIQNTMSAYCRYIDTKAWNSLREVLTEDVSIRFTDIQGETIASFNKPEELIDSCKQVIENAMTIHHLHNPEFIHLTDTDAEVIWAMEDRWYMDKKDKTDFTYFQGYGHYRTTLIYENGIWKINSFTLKRLQMTYK